MKKLFTALFTVAIIFSVTMIMAKDSPGKVTKGKIENVAEAPTQVQLEHKEALKIDDGEYTGAVISKSYLSASSVNYLGIAAVAAGLAAFVIYAFRNLTRRSAVSATLRLVLASLVLVLSKGVAPLAGMVLAGAIMAGPTLLKWSSFRRLSRLGEGEQQDDPDTAELKAIKQVADQIKGYKKDLEGKISKEEFSALEKKMNDAVEGLKKELKENFDKRDFAAIESQMKTMNTVVEELRDHVAKSKDQGTEGDLKKPLLTRKEVEDFVNATFKDGKKTSSDAAIKIDTNLVLRTKAAETFGYSTFFDGGAGTDISAFTGRQIDPTLYQRRRKRNLILDNWAIESISVPKLVYLEKKEVAGSGDSGSTTSVGGAEWIASGASKPLRSFRVTSAEVEAKKLAIFGTVEDKLLRDVPSLENWIRDDFTQEMRETYNDGLLNNNPAIDSDAPLGLKTNAIQYSATTAFDEAIVDPNYIDMIVAACAKMSDLKEQPGIAFVSADVFYAMLILKDNEARYHDNGKIFVNSLGQMYIGGVQIVPCDSEDVPSTHLLLVAMDPGFKIKNYGPVVFERGLNGNDFREDKTSYRGYQEVLSYIPEHRENTIMYDTWVNIEAAITAPAS